MEETIKPLELLKSSYQERAKRLNGMADAALSEAIDSYCAAQEKMISSANEASEAMAKKAKAEADEMVHYKETKASEAILAAYIEHGLRD